MFNIKIDFQWWSRDKDRVKKVIVNIIRLRHYIKIVIHDMCVVFILFTNVNHTFQWHNDSKKSNAVVAHEWRDEHKPVQLVWSDDSITLKHFFKDSLMHEENLAIILNANAQPICLPSP